MQMVYIIVTKLFLYRNALQKLVMAAHYFPYPNFISVVLKVANN